MQSVYLGKFSSLYELETFRKSIGTAFELVETDDAYSTDNWMKRQQRFYELSLLGQMPRHSNLPLILSLRPNSRVLDIGGGSGWIFNILGQNSNYKNLEIDSVREFFSKEYNSASRYISNKREIITFKPEILYANSVLQYLTSEKEFEEIVLMGNPQHILLDDLYLTEEEDFFSLQRYYGKFIPTIILSSTRLEEALENLGYSLLLDISFHVSHTSEMRMEIELSDGGIEGIAPPRTMMFTKLNTNLRGQNDT